MGWGLDLHWAALARERGWRCGVLDAVAIAHAAAPAADAYSRAAAIAEARAFLAERPYLERPRSPADPRRAPQPVKVAVVAEFYPRRGDPVLGRLGPPPGAGRARRRRRGAGARPAPPRAAPRRADAPGPAARRARSGGLLREPRHQVRDGLPVTYVPYVSPPREPLLRVVGSVGGARAGARPAPAAPPWRLRRDPRPQRRPRRRRRAPRRPRRAARGLGARRRRPLHGHAPARVAARRSRAGSAPRAWCSPTAAASPARRARTARARSGSCTSAPITPRSPPGAHRARRRS